MCTGLKEMWSELRGQTILFSGFLCAFQILTFIYWVQDKYMTVTALLHCIGAMLIILGALTVFLLYLPHMINHLEATTKPRQTAAIMILIGGILHFIGSILAILNPIYCNYYLCEVHLFVFMILPFTITIILFLDEFFLIFYRKIRFRIVIYSFILFLSGILFIPYYATLQKNEGDDVGVLMAILYQIIWIIIIINCSFLMLCVGCKHKKIRDDTEQKRATWDSITLSSKRNSFSPSNPYNIESGGNNNNTIQNDSDCCRMHENKRKTMILINCLLLIVFGSATLITVYFYKNDQHYDIILCFYCLVVMMAWFIGIDSIKYYKDIEYEPIHNPQQMTIRKKRHTSSDNNPFNRNAYHGDNGMYPDDDDEEDDHINAYDNDQSDDDEAGYNANINNNNNNNNNRNNNQYHNRNHRMIIEHNDLDYNNNRNAWTIPPTQNNDDEHNQFKQNYDNNAYI